MESIEKRLAECERPKRMAISRRFPALLRPAIFIRRLLRSAANRISLEKLRTGAPLACVVARHSSLLYKKLGESDAELQRNKVVNLKRAIEKLDGLIIPPGKTFSFWDIVGRASCKNGFVDGMLISNGTVTKGVGGGLCQLSNFLFWSFLHADVEIVERHHHSMDIFPDSGRTLPFGSGATVFDNYLDLQAKNVSSHPLQIRLWLTEDSLKGQLLSDAPAEKKFHISERNHCFIRKGDRFFRYNELFRETYKDGIKLDEKQIIVNFAPVTYTVTEAYLKGLDYRLITYDSF